MCCTPYGAQNLAGRVHNALVYLGSLVVERARVLPMYARLCASFDIDCFDRELLHSTAMFLCAPPLALCGLERKHCAHFALVPLDRLDHGLLPAPLCALHTPWCRALSA